MNNTITLNHAQKIALLEAVQNGVLDLSIFDKQSSNELTPEAIERELLRLEMIDGLREKAALLLKLADKEITEDEYIAIRLGGCNQPKTTQH